MDIILCLNICNFPAHIRIMEPILGMFVLNLDMYFFKDFLNFHIDSKSNKNWNSNLLNSNDLRF